MYEIFTSGQFNNQEVRVYVCQNKADKWVKVSNDLNSNLKIMEVLEYNYVNFSLLIENMRNIDSPSFSNAFNVIIRNAQ